MHTTDAELTPAERLREIAAILAAGILRQRTRLESPPEPAACESEKRLKRNLEIRGEMT